MSFLEKKMDEEEALINEDDEEGLDNEEDGMDNDEDLDYPGEFNDGTEDLGDELPDDIEKME